jgi:hypothetical protein
MFDKKFEDRLAIWKKFRDSLEASLDPLQDVINFYKRTPLISMAADPYTPSSWPDPWELLEENNYCPFVKILAIFYTLQLTDRFSNSEFVIHITYNDANSSTYYLLYVDDRVIGLDGDIHVHRDSLPKNLRSIHEHRLQPLQ